MAEHYLEVGFYISIGYGVRVHNAPDVGSGTKENLLVNGIGMAGVELLTSPQAPAKDPAAKDGRLLPSQHMQ
jgi:hypothetical protein